MNHLCGRVSECVGVCVFYHHLSVNSEPAAGTNQTISPSFLLFLLYMQTHQGLVCVCTSLNMCVFPTSPHVVVEAAKQAFLLMKPGKFGFALTRHARICFSLTTIPRFPI